VFTKKPMWNFISLNLFDEFEIKDDVQC
jgi:hypothetical protein